MARTIVICMVYSAAEEVVYRKLKTKGSKGYESVYKYTRGKGKQKGRNLSIPANTAVGST